MSELEYLQTELMCIKRNADKARNELMRDYAFRNAKFAVGDILKGVTFTIIVDKLMWHQSQNQLSSEINPVVVYRGRRLTKKMEPRKDGDTALIPDNEKGLIKLENKNK